MPYLIANNSALVDDIDSMINSFGQNVSTRADMWNQSSDIVFDPSVRDNNDSIGICIEIFKSFVEVSKVNFYKVFIFAVYCIKRKMIRKTIYQMKSSWEFFV